MTGNISEIPATVSANWDEVRKVRSRIENKRLRSLSVRDSFQQFEDLLQFAEKLHYATAHRHATPREQQGKLKKLRESETDQLVRWKARIDTLGRGNEE